MTPGAQAESVEADASVFEFLEPQSELPPKRYPPRESPETIAHRLERTKSSPPPSISNEQASRGLSLVLTAAVALATSIITGHLYILASGQHSPGTLSFLGAGVLITLFFCTILRLSKQRQPLKLSGIYDRAGAALIAWLTSFALFVIIAFVFKFGTEISRGATLLFFAVGLIATTLAHMHIPIILARTWTPSTFMRDVIILGARGDATIDRLASGFADGSYCKPYVIEFDATCGATIWPRECKAFLAEVTSLARRLGPGDIYLAISKIAPDRIDSILRALTMIPRAVLVVPDEFTARLLRQPLSEVGRELAIDIQRAPMGLFSRGIKRAMDILISSIAIMFLAPLLLVVAITIKLDSPGPVLFTQTRNGYRGQPFRIFKFRSMSVMEDGNHCTQVRKNDDRVTRFGRWLRKTSIDELPQLFNVLRGEMSLIGPRPHPGALDATFSELIDNYEIRQHVKPGITGWAQVHGLRGETPTVDLMYRRIEFDMWYTKNRSILLDLIILARTILELVRPRNAY